jgi:hypothetical protein
MTREGGHVTMPTPALLLLVVVSFTGTLVCDAGEKPNRATIALDVVVEVVDLARSTITARAATHAATGALIKYLHHDALLNPSGG